MHFLFTGPRDRRPSGGARGNMNHCKLELGPKPGPEPGLELGPDKGLGFEPEPGPEQKAEAGLELGPETEPGLEL